MKQLKTIALTLTLAAMLALFAGCGASNGPAAGDNSAQPPAEDQTASTITVVVMMGREVTLTEVPQRVVALSAGECEILYALGAEDTLVGRGTYCDYPAEILEIPALSSGSETNLEEIIALQPQLVLMTSMDQPQEQVDALEAAGIRVAVTNADNIAGTYEAIELIGTLLGKDAEAEAVIGEMKATFEELKSKVSGDGTKTVYFEVSPLQYGLWAAAGDTFMNEVSEVLGLQNIFADVSGWAEVSEEQVIERDPDYIVTISMYFGEGPTPEEEILSRSGWENVTAVKNGAILNLQNNELSRPTPRLAEGAQMLYDFVFGEG